MYTANSNNTMCPNALRKSHSIYTKKNNFLIEVEHPNPIMGFLPKLAIEDR